MGEKMASRRLNVPHIPALVQYLIVDKPLGSTRIGNNSRTIIFQQNKTPSSSSDSSWLMRLIAKSMDIPSLCLVGMLNPYRISTFFNHHYVHLKILRPNLSFLMDSFSLHSCAWSSTGTFGFLVSFFASKPWMMPFMSFYVTWMPGIIWSPLPLIEQGHGYDESVFTSITAFMKKWLEIWLIGIKSWKLSLMVCLYFAGKAFCLSSEQMM